MRSFRYKIPSGDGRRICFNSIRSGTIDVFTAYLHAADAPTPPGGSAE